MFSHNGARRLLDAFRISLGFWTGGLNASGLKCQEPIAKFERDFATLSWVCFRCVFSFSLFFIGVSMAETHLASSSPVSFAEFSMSFRVFSHP